MEEGIIELSVALTCVDPVREAEAVVVIDVLRATTVVAVALANGAQGVIPVRSVDQARELAASGPGYLLGGEFENRRIAGFDCGNSPFDYATSVVEGRRVVLRTTNGTQAFAALAGLDTAILCAAFVNVAAVVAHLKRQRYRSVAFLCAGQDERFSLEDFVCAGAIVHALGEDDPHVRIDDAGLAARALFEQERFSLLALLAIGNHAEDLRAVGAQADIAFAAQLDLLDVVPIMRDGMLICGEHCK
ncbi:MAG TPA: 2-phosphosulfolactate phosphatase [Candidatus Dormibacteraeota bacterium]|nr:2-phosphosulfolactate phosphatase [Candidatus Dormibacteraeota bacterium]